MNETTTMMHVICGCTHAAYYHNPGKGCDFCDCLYDPRQILLERIDTLEAVAEAARVFLPAVKNSTHDWGAYASARDALEAALELVE